MGVSLDTLVARLAAAPDYHAVYPTVPPTVKYALISGTR
jgi:hypothetical protein